MLFDRAKNFTGKIIKHKRKPSRAAKAGQRLKLLSAYTTLFLSALAIGVVMCAQNSNLYLHIQEKCGLFEGENSLDRRAVTGMNESVVDYLSGRTNKIENASERANLHMQDVKKIFDRTETTGLVLIACAALLRIKLRDICHSAYISLVPVALALLVFAFFAFSDFTQLFYGFHELLFENDLWLLNPQEDFLIRCLPEEFFYWMAINAFIRALFLYVLFCFGTFVVNKFGRRD